MERIGARGSIRIDVDLAALPAVLVWLSLGFYLVVRLVALPDFPIYFFTDEAIQTVQAADLVRLGFHNQQGELLPTFFQNGHQYNLGVSVYLQVIPTLLFGKSIWVTRGAAVLATLLAAASAGLILDKVFHSRQPWLGILILSATPAWFLHSRTAFETALAVSWYAVFLVLYMLYRSGRVRCLYAAALFGALAFYTYNPMRVIMLVTAGLFFLSDLPFHLRQKTVLAKTLGLCALLALPFFRFLLTHPDATALQMRLLGSYWVADIPLWQKLSTFAGTYLNGLDPRYWYIPHTQDLARHTMAGYGHLLVYLLPLGLAGVCLALCRIRQWQYRTLLLAVLAVPSGAALVQVGITRTLVMVIPMTILTALAAQGLIDWLARRRRLLGLGASLALSLALVGVNAYMLVDSLSGGPLWYKDYTLTGMQYGAKQVFGEVAAYLGQNPDARVIVSPNWSNGTDVVARFFFSDPLPISLAGPVAFFKKVLPFDENTLLVMTPEEFASIPTTRFSEVRVEQIIPYPDGRPGFYFVHLKYVENVQAVIDAEEAERRRLMNGRFLMNGYTVDVTYPKLDIGSPDQFFDKNGETLARSWAFNPLELTLDFPVCYPAEGLLLRVGGAPTDITIKVWFEGAKEPFELARSLPSATLVRDVSFDFPQPGQVSRLWLSIKNTDDPPEANVHLWEITLK